MRWFTSDLHLNHTNIIDYTGRPFSNVDEMNGVICARWNERISPADEVFLVGDAFLGDPAQGDELIGSFNGRKTLILGNHDRHKRELRNVFSVVVKRLDLALKDGRRALLRHVPMPSDDLYAYDLQVHGHHHAGLRVNGKHVNVCVDLWDFRPISEDELCSLQLGKPEPSEVQVDIVDGGRVIINVDVPLRKLDGLIESIVDMRKRRDP